MRLCMWLSWNPRSVLVRHDNNSVGGGKPASTNARCGVTNESLPKAPCPRKRVVRPDYSGKGVQDIERVALVEVGMRNLEQYVGGVWRGHGGSVSKFRTMSPHSFHQSPGTTRTRPRSERQSPVWSPPNTRRGLSRLRGKVSRRMPDGGTWRRRRSRRT